MSIVAVIVAMSRAAKHASPFRVTTRLELRIQLLMFGKLVIIKMVIFLSSCESGYSTF